jgi:DNA-binding transcriptional regulator LsrR (DeoR family)
MLDTITPDEIVEAAQGLPQEEFTRADLAEKLGVDKSELRDSFKAARKAGRLEKTRDDDEDTRYFRLTGN